MWNYIYYCQVFFLTSNAVLKSAIKTNPQHEVEAVFTDVIKNISRVNDVLQELIQNYERLQKIYKSQEVVESDLSSDNEIDKVFQSKRQTSSTKTPSKNNIQLATQMIWSDIEKSDDENGNINQHDKANKTIQSPQVVQEKHKNGKPKSSSECSSDSVSNEKNIQDTLNDEDAITSTKKKPNKNKHNNHSSNIGNKLTSTTKIQKHKRYKLLQGMKINTNNKVNENRDKKQSEPTIFLRHSNVTKDIGVILNYQIYDDTKKMSVRSQLKEKEPLHQTKNYSEQNKRARNRPAKKTALILVKNDMEQPTISTSNENSSAEDEQAIHKELFKTNVLREAYGEACLKLVVRKCYKACKTAAKFSCHEYRCKSTFMSMFNNHSKTGCIKEFQGGTKELPVNKTSKYIRQDKSKETMPVGYLDAACKDDLKTEPVVLRNATVTSKSAPIISTGDKENVNLLRDRYEKACKEISMRKCNAACKYAVNQTCTSMKCVSGHIRKFYKNCKRQCRVSYSGRLSYNRKDDSESTDLSSSGSISSSGSDS